MKILIVDDNRGIRKLTRNLLEDIADEIFECADGDEAVNSYSKLQPDLVLMDIKMKKLNGIAATKLIIKENPAAKIIIATNYNDEAMRRAALEAGAAEYLLKENISTIGNIIINITQHH